MADNTTGSGDKTSKNSQLAEKVNDWWKRKADAIALKNAQKSAQIRASPQRQSGGVKFKNFVGNINSKKNEGSKIAFFFVALIIQTIDAFTGYSRLGQTARFVLYMILFIWGWFVFVKGSGNIKQNGGILLLLFLLSFGIPLVRFLIVKYIPLGTFMKGFVSGFDFLVVFTPAWVIYTMYSSEDIPFLRVIGTWYLIFWLILFFWWYFKNINEVFFQNLPVSAVDPYKPMKEVGKIMKDFWRNGILVTTEQLGKLPTLFERGWNATITPIVGPQPGVEESVQKAFGVFIRNMEPIQTEYYVGEPVAVLADLEAENIGIDPIDVSVVCYAEDYYGEGETVIAEQIYPPGIFQMEGSQREQIDCTFLNENEGNKLVGDAEYEILLNVTFSFETDARIQTYWMDNVRYKTLILEGEDALEKLEMPEEEPVAIFTSGPVKVGMSVGNPPIRIGENVIDPRLRISLESNWMKGKIIKVDSLKIYVPNQLALDLNSCTDKLEEEGIEGEYRVYRLTTPIDLIDEYRAISC